MNTQRKTGVAHTNEAYDDVDGENSNGFGRSSEFSDVPIQSQNDVEAKGANGIPSRVTLSWKNVTVRVAATTFLDTVKSKFNNEPGKEQYKTILNSVSGIVKPGQMLALMGSSGSGKTTLLNVLNFRSNSNLKVDGGIMINGTQVDATRMSMVSCYVQQDDLFFGTLTVQEHLKFHAMLRMDQSIAKEQKIKRVAEVLKQFNLEVCKDVRIGIPGRIKGISGGQMRRLSFASEILTDPPVLFCDEPTSGLDSFMAKSIIYCLRTMAASGKTVICTIHQPSSEIFALFDRICLLAEGNIAYFGERDNALEFYENNLKIPCPQFSNPADFYMDKLGVDVNNEKESRAQIQSYCQKFKASIYNQNLIENIHRVKPKVFHVPRRYTPYKATWLTQVVYLFQRCVFNYFRNYRVVINDFLMALLTAALGGAIYFNSAERADGECRFSQKTASNLSTALFYTVTVMTMLSVLSAVMAFPLEIPIFYREHYTAVYRSDAYYISKILLEIPLYVIIPLLHALTIYYMVVFGCGDKNFGLFLLTLILIANCAFSLGHVLSIVGSSVNMAISLAAPVLALQMLFSGFFLKKAENTPAFFTYFKFLSVFNYGYDLLMINQWEYVEKLTCEDSTGKAFLCKPSGPYILNELKIRPKNKPFYIAMLVLLTIFWRLLAYLILFVKCRRQTVSLSSFTKLFTKDKTNEHEPDNNDVHPTEMTIEL